VLHRGFAASSKRRWASRPDFWHDQLARLVEHIAHVARTERSASGGYADATHVHMAIRKYRAAGSLADHERADVLEQRLLGPPVPPPLEYLYRWHDELFGRSGAGMDGPAPLTYSTILDWAILTDRTVLPHEVMALVRLDDVRRHPPEPKVSTDA